MGYNNLKKKPDVRILSQKLKLTAEKTAATPYTNDEISNGIKNIQRAFELNEKKLKLTSRRGAAGPINPFQLKVNHRNRRYVIKHQTKSGFKILKWTKTDLVWQIYKPWTGKLSKSKQEEIFEKAFKIWEYASPLRFVKKTAVGGPWPDIDIEFHKGRYCNISITLIHGKCCILVFSDTI